ncbi:ribonuclease T2 family protein [Sphingomonas sp. CJ20]
MRRIGFVTAAALAMLLPQAALAQAQMCSIPARVPVPRPDLPSESQPRRILPIGSYTLALTWSPGFCRANGNRPDAAFQCGGANRFGFTLHGLWPDGYGKDWPQYCKSTPILPPRVIRATLCSTPSAQLIQHEWAKHGTCTAMTPTQYFAKARQLYAALRFPDRAALARGPLTVARFRAAMAAVNPGLPATSIRVTTTRDDALDELWLCLDKRFRYERCKPGTGGAPDAAVLKITG